MTLTFLAVVFFHLYGHLPEFTQPHPTYHPLWLRLFLASIFLAGLMVLRVWWLRLDQRRLDYRSLAEALRVRLYWAAAGCSRSVADSYLNQLRGAMSWARRALQGVAPIPEEWRTRFAGHNATTKLAMLRAVQQTWIKEQVDYYHRRHHVEHKAAIGLRRAAITMTIIGWIAGGSILLPHTSSTPTAAITAAPLAHLATQESSGNATREKGFSTQNAKDGISMGGHEEVVHNASHPKHSVLVASALLIVLGGFLNAWCEKRTHEELAHHYNRLAAVFEQGGRELEIALAGEDILQAQAILESLGQEAIAEHAQWLILRRARPFELHLG